MTTDSPKPSASARSPGSSVASIVELILSGLAQDVGIRQEPAGARARASSNQNCGKRSDELLVDFHRSALPVSGSRPRMGLRLSPIDETERIFGTATQS